MPRAGIWIILAFVIAACTDDDSGARKGADGGSGGGGGGGGTGGADGASADASTDVAPDAEAGSAGDASVDSDGEVGADADADADADAEFDSGADSDAEAGVDGGGDATTDSPASCVSPTAGQLRISEWMPDPTLVADSAGEWFEVVALANFDLNGLQAGAAALDPTPLVPASGPCVHLGVGQRALFARSSASGTNGQLPSVLATFGFGLPATGTLRIGVGGATLDTVTWINAQAGRSIMIDTDGTQCDAPTGVSAYNGQDVGTPGSSNTPPECP